MYQMKAIGKLEANEKETVIKVEDKYRKALKFMNEFSHIHIFYVGRINHRYTMRKSVAEVRRVNQKGGMVIASPIKEMKNAELIDLKPYFPSEDTVKSLIEESKVNETEQQMTREMQVEWNPHLSVYEINTIGEIRNVNGRVYIQLQDIPCLQSDYITVFWWFHKFDKEMYRDITECNPPYENAPASGIFATRSPVRPNPIAMTVARVLEFDKDKNRIYINHIESFDHTPCIGVYEYHAQEDCVKDCRIPKWLAHWPKYLDESVYNPKEEKLKIIDSGIEKLFFDDSESKQSECDLQSTHIEEKNSMEILVRGARENNLKGIDVSIPYGKITAVVGVSGSGKSSLVNQTIYAECRRRMEYLSSQHIRLQKPKVDEMTGCIPTVVITQDAIRGNAYSTVGTYTDAYDCLRTIYANCAIKHCPDCGNAVIPLSRSRILDILKQHKVNAIYNLNQQKLSKNTIESTVDIALKEGEGAFYAELEQYPKVLFQTTQKCYHCDKILFEMTPASFSYMDTDSRCPVCKGTGKVSVIDEHKIIEKPELSLLEGASSFYGKLKGFQENPNANWMKGQVFGLADAMKVDLQLPWKELPIAFKEALLHGIDQEVTFTYHNKKNGRKGEIRRKVEGLYSILERVKEENENTSIIDKYMKKTNCQACAGERLNREGRSATLHGKRYPEAAQMTFIELRDFCKKIRNSMSNEVYQKAELCVQSLLETCETAIQLGIGYLPLNQATGTLSGGEGQRLKLLGAFKNHISGILYIFDEPSKGLHPKDYNKIVGLFHKLILQGNTIIMVEHNEDMMRIADHVIEIGPGAGEYGGMLVGEGTLEAMLHHKGTQICRYLGTKNIAKSVKIEGKRMNYAMTEKDYQFMHFKNLTQNNLKNISVALPCQALTCICGVSGSGKSTLMRKEIFPHAQQIGKDFKEVIMVDQSAIGKTSKSIVATYIGFMDFIRKLYTQSATAKQNNWDESYFSFNSANGQCETCKGDGKIKVRFTEDASTICPECKGKRYRKDILLVTYQGKAINEILDLSINQAIVFFHDYEEELQGLQSLQKVGLGYLKLGQGTSTLSGGEAARLKLAQKLITKGKGNILYLLDEPTTGLHFSDIENLMKLIRELILSGNTVVAIEHNKQFLQECDWKIELGPGAGKDGGFLLEMKSTC